jgi:hypothetical protein
MNGTKNPLPGFEERLLAELREVVAERAAERDTGERPPARRLTGRSRLVAGAAAVALGGAAVAFGVPLLAGDAGAPAAYAVESGAGGRITVTINRLEDAEGLEHQLAAHGVQARVAYTPKGKTCKGPWFTGSDRLVDVDVMPTPTAGGASFTFRPAELGDGRTLVIHNTAGGPLKNAPSPTGLGYQNSISLVSLDENDSVHTVTIAINVADGPVGSCEVVDAPR